MAESQAQKNSIRIASIEEKLEHLATKEYIAELRAEFRDGQKEVKFSIDELVNQMKRSDGRVTTVEKVADEALAKSKVAYSQVLENRDRIESVSSKLDTHINQHQQTVAENVGNIVFDDHKFRFFVIAGAIVFVLLLTIADSRLLILDTLKEILGVL